MEDFTARKLLGIFIFYLSWINFEKSFLPIAYLSNDIFGTKNSIMII